MPPSRSGGTAQAASPAGAIGPERTVGLDLAGSQRASRGRATYYDALAPPPQAHVGPKRFAEYSLLILSRGERGLAGLLLGIGCLVAITPLGVEVLPDPILAAGLRRLAREPYPETVVGAESMVDDHEGEKAARTKEARS